MNVSHLSCAECKAEYPFSITFKPCARCGHPLEIAYATSISFDNSLPSRGSIWRFRDILPVPPDARCVSLGEGGTPLIDSDHLLQRLGVRAFLKNEAANPTLSFKDRLNSLNATLAKAYGFKGLVASSTGNHGVSSAAYAAAAGLRSIVLLPLETPEVIVRMIESYGGEARRMAWDDRSRHLTEQVERSGEWFPSKSSLPAPLSNPFGLEAYKTIAYEIALDFGGNIPDYIIIPVGSGDNIYGLCKGFQELLKIGIIARLPRLVSCEIEGGAPVKSAFDSHAARVAALPRKQEALALSISEGISSNHALRAIRLSDGLAAAVSEEEIAWAMRELARCGFCAESSSAATVAAARQLISDGLISDHQTVLLILTSSGVKWPNQIPSLLNS